MLVIQSKMSPKAIAEAWENTKDVFHEYNVPISGKSLETLVDKDILDSLLSDLNNTVGSTTATCIEGGWQLSSKKE